jgi:arginyl-tRNA synthetase
MINPWGRFKGEVCEAIELALQEAGWQYPLPVEQTLEEPPSPSLGDLATTICFELARSQRKTPQSLAAELKNHIRPTGLISRAEQVGGYINFFVDVTKLAEFTLPTIKKADLKYGHLKIGQGKKIVIEHTSINPTKPLHIGHGRNAVIGDTLARIFRALGYKVEVQNYIDDMGLQVAETILAYQMIEPKPKTKFDHMLGLIYVDIHKRMESDPEIEKKVREILGQLESGGEFTRLGRWLSEKCVRANLKTTDRLKITYDLLAWESDIARSGMLQETLNRLRATPYLVEGDGEHKGTLILRLADFGIEDKVLVRSNGTAVYTARDIAYQLWKFGKVKAELLFKFHSKRPDGTKTFTTSPRGKPSRKFGNADIVINVIGAEQKFPQQVVFTALRALGLEDEYKNSYHLAHEHVWLPEGKFSGRTGTWVGYSVDEAIEEAVERAWLEVEKRKPGAGKDFKKRTAEIVGIGAIRYSLIQTSPEKKVVFKWEEALNFEKNSAPAIQYSHARACSILRKSKGLVGKPDYRQLKLPEEQRLIKLLAKFPEVLLAAEEKLQPNLLALYAAELALEFNKFYEVAPVLDAEAAELRATRLMLVDCVRITIRNALNLLGIVAPEEM